MSRLAHPMCRLIGLGLFALPSLTLAAEGMWLLSQAAALSSRLHQAGLEIDPSSLDDLKAPPLGAIVSLGEDSGSFLSPQGLVVTAHHVVLDSLQYNSRPGKNYLADGFFAETLADELPAAPGSHIDVLEEVRDVTQAMERRANERMSGLERDARIAANRKALIAACEQQPGRRCEVKEDFGGARYRLLREFEIKDVRLVYAPPSGVGYFGGETDDWMWPRHTGDFSFYRAYVAPDGSSAPNARGNVPYRPKVWLKVARRDLKAGDFVMVAGFPQHTHRLRTAAEARFTFETYSPSAEASLSTYIAQLDRAIAAHPDAALDYASVMRDAHIALKKIQGQIAGADRLALVHRKTAEEKVYRDWIAADSNRQRYAAAAAALDRVLVDDQRAQMNDLVLDTLDRCQLLQAARLLYRWAKEREKRDAERAEGYQDRDRPAFEDKLAQIERQFTPDVDRTLLAAALDSYRTSNARDVRFLEKLDAIGLDRAYAMSRLAETSVRLSWLNRPISAFETSADPFISLAVVLYPGDRARERAAQDRRGRAQAARSLYLRGLLAFAAEHGREIYPDADGSLRLTYGSVTGRAVDGETWTPFTSAEGLVARNTGKGEFAAPERMIDRIGAKDYGSYASSALRTLPVDFLSDLDVSGGNSGSATLNARGEFVGVVFDVSLDGVISDWVFEPSINRTIHVDSRFMAWVMDRVDGAQRLLEEMQWAE